MTTKIPESRENYLETILILQQKQGMVRSIDIAEQLQFSKPSVSRAVSLLRQDGLIIKKPDGRIILTETGQKLAESIYDKHRTLTEFFLRLGVSQITAVEDACKIEHIISSESLARIRQFLSADFNSS